MEITSILNKLQLTADGQYDNGFYNIQLTDSNEYAKIYTKLCSNAINTEYPSFFTNTNLTTTKATHYFELEDNSKTYNIFLIADFEQDIYTVRIGEK